MNEKGTFIMRRDTFFPYMNSVFLFQIPKLFSDGTLCPRSTIESPRSPLDLANFKILWRNLRLSETRFAKLEIGCYCELKEATKLKTCGATLKNE